jgi:hypothetical protein
MTSQNDDVSKWSIHEMIKSHMSSHRTYTHLVLPRSGSLLSMSVCVCVCVRVRGGGCVWVGVWSKSLAWVFGSEGFKLAMVCYKTCVWRLRACWMGKVVTADAMGWLRLVGSLKLQVYFAKEPYQRDDILQKRPVILRSLLIVATPYALGKQQRKKSVCVRQRERAIRETMCVRVCVRVYVFVCERESEKERKKQEIDTGTHSGRSARKGFHRRARADTCTRTNSHTI